MPTDDVGVRTVVTARPCKDQMVDIPYKLFLALDAHAKRIAQKLNLRLPSG